MRPKKPKKPTRLCVFSPEEVTVLAGAIVFLKEQIRHRRDEPGSEHYISILTRIESELKLSDEIAHLILPPDSKKC